MPQYTIVFEEHLDPIKKRGKVVLTEALPEGSSLQIIRKTPIIADFTAEALKPFPSEAFENALDRICFIQQELEGHLCDCRGDVYIGTPPVSDDTPSYIGDEI